MYTKPSGIDFFSSEKRPHRFKEKPIPEYYPEIDTDLARDNIENDLSAADLLDLYPDKS